MNYPNPMQKPKISKVVLNIGVGESGEKLGKAENLLQQISGRKPVRTFSKHKIPTWGLKKGDPIGCKVTLRGTNAEEMLKRGFSAIDNHLIVSQFDVFGNLSFGIHEYIDIPGIKYDPNIGIFGMNITVTVERPGYSVKKKMIHRVKIPKKNLITPQESMEFIKEKFGVKIENE